MRIKNVTNKHYFRKLLKRCPIHRVPIPLHAPTPKGSKPPGGGRAELRDVGREEEMRGGEGVGVGRLLEKYLTGSWKDCKLI